MGGNGIFRRQIPMSPDFIHHLKRLYGGCKLTLPAAFSLYERHAAVQFPGAAGFIGKGNQLFFISGPVFICPLE